MDLLDNVTPLREALDYHLARHNLLTANLAHVDTPGYTPVDLERGATFSDELERALAGGEGVLSGDQTPSYRVVLSPDGSAGLDGNSVSIEVEASKIAENNIRYEAIGNLIQGQLSSLLWAASGGGSAG
jgi:flagellar basal-body rod protein FlgB